MTRPRPLRPAWFWGCGHQGDAAVWPVGGEVYASCPECAWRDRAAAAALAEIAIPVVSGGTVQRFRLPKRRRR